MSVPAQPQRVAVDRQAKLEQMNMRPPQPVDVGEFIKPKLQSYEAFLKKTEAKGLDDVSAVNDVMGVLTDPTSMKHGDAVAGSEPNAHRYAKARNKALNHLGDLIGKGGVEVRAAALSSLGKEAQSGNTVISVGEFQRLYDKVEYNSRQDKNTRVSVYATQCVGDMYTKLDDLQKNNANALLAKHVGKSAPEVRGVALLSMIRNTGSAKALAEMALSEDPAIHARERDLALAAFERFGLESRTDILASVFEAKVLHDFDSAKPERTGRAKLQAQSVYAMTKIMLGSNPEKYAPLVQKTIDSTKDMGYVSANNERHPVDNPMIQGARGDYGSIIEPVLHAIGETKTADRFDFKPMVAELPPEGNESGWVDRVRQLTSNRNKVLESMTQGQITGLLGEVSGLVVKESKGEGGQPGRYRRYALKGLEHVSYGRLEGQDRENAKSMIQAAKIQAAGNALGYVQGQMAKGDWGDKGELKPSLDYAYSALIEKQDYGLDRSPASEVAQQAAALSGQVALESSKYQYSIRQAKVMDGNGIHWQKYTEGSESAVIQEQREEFSKLSERRRNGEKDPQPGDILSQNQRRFHSLEFQRFKESIASK